MVGLISISHASFDKLLWVPTSRIWGYPMLKQLTGWKKSQTRQPRALSDCTKLEGCSQEQVLWSLRWQGQKSEIRKRKRIFFFFVSSTGRHAGVALPVQITAWIHSSPSSWISKARNFLHSVTGRDWEAPETETNFSSI